MSTKVSLVYGDNFHLYHECMDNTNSVYLRIDKAEFRASKDSVCIVIPPDIWEAIRKFGVDFSLADKTDNDILKMVEKEVDDRIKEYSEADERAKGLISFCGSLVYGEANSSRKKQIKSGLKHFHSERAKQIEILEKSKKYKVIR